MEHSKNGKFEMTMELLISELQIHRAYFETNEKFMVEMLSGFYEMNPDELQAQYSATHQVYLELRDTEADQKLPWEARVLHHTLLNRAALETLLVYVAHIFAHLEGLDPDASVQAMYVYRQQVLADMTGLGF